MIHGFCEHLLQRIRDDKKTFLDTLQLGSVKNIEDYRFICGNIRGLERTEKLVKETFKSLFEGKALTESKEGDNYEVELYRDT